MDSQKLCHTYDTPNLYRLSLGIINKNETMGERSDTTHPKPSSGSIEMERGKERKRRESNSAICCLSH